jgi:hypothetical protein
MVSWENRGIAQLYLCESHANQVGFLGESCEGVPSMTPQSARTNHATGQANGSVPSGGPTNAQIGLEKEYLGVARAPASDLTSGDSAKVLAVEANGNMAREDFEAYGIVLQRAPSTATEETRAESADLERLCVSCCGERCASEAAVHCPKCRMWFCDAHAEDGKWHPCALPTYK